MNKHDLMYMLCKYEIRLADVCICPCNRSFDVYDR